MSERTDEDVAGLPPAEPVGPPRDRTPYILMAWILVCFLAGLLLLALSAYFT